MQSQTERNLSAPASAKPAGRRPVILLVDDEAPVRRVLGRILEREGYTVLPAENGLDALGYALWPGQRVDLVITDVTMPVLGGNEFVQHLRESQPDMPVLYVSGYPKSSADLDGASNTHFLLKPFDPAQLTETVRGLLQPDTLAA